MKKVISSQATTLRQKAEEQLKMKSSTAVSRLSEEDTLNLIHELQVHQIELEMQIEELRVAKDQADRGLNNSIKELVYQSEEKQKRADELAMANKELSEFKNQLVRFNSQIINSAQEGIIVYDRNLKIEVWNPFMEKFSGSPASETIGRYPLDVFPFLKVAGVIGILEKALNGEIGNEVDFPFSIPTTGKTGWASDTTAPLYNSKNEIIGVISTVRDITERKFAELELIKAKEKAEENEVLFRNLFENSPIGKSMTAIDGSLHVNKSFCDIVGYSEEELKGMNWTEISYPEDIPLANEQIRLLLNGEIAKTRFEKRYIHKNGNIIWIDLSTYLQRDKENKTQSFITTIIDITARKNFENDLIKAKEHAEESDRLKSAFLTNMSHEIRTPMNGILGFIDLLKKPNLSSEDKQVFLQTIQISGNRMLNTINNIVDMSKIESGHMNLDIKGTNINEKIEFIYKFFKPEIESKGLKFLFTNGLQTKDAVIGTDIEKAYAILTNLVRNAIKFTSEGSIEFGYVQKTDKVSGSTESGRNAELEFFVKDTGIGIPKNQHQMIFERFRQGSESNNRGYEGSGLGLPICKSYLEMLGGKIWVESEEGKGSIFYFTIPYNPMSEETYTIENDAPAGLKELQMKNLKILIAEDDEISYLLLAQTLQEISTEFLHAITGVEAIEACRSNPDIDLVLMDIRMREMDGLEATQRIRQFNKDVIIIAQTANAFAVDGEKAIEAGCNDYITKPINMTHLFELIRKYFGN